MAPGFSDEIINKDKKHALLEIEPRIAGTMATNGVRGIIFCLLNI